MTGEFQTVFFTDMPRIPGGCYGVSVHELRAWKKQFHGYSDLEFEVFEGTCVDKHGKKYAGYIKPANDLSRNCSLGWFVGRRSK